MEAALGNAGNAHVAATATAAPRQTRTYIVSEPIDYAEKQMVVDLPDFSEINHSFTQ